MSEPNKELLQEIGLFRHGLFADRVHQPPGTQGVVVTHFPHRGDSGRPQKASLRPKGLQL